MSLYLRLSLFYIAYFSMIGMHLPFWPVWLESQGLTAREIGFVMSSSILIKVLTGPWIAGIADRSGHRRRLMRTLALLSLGIYLAFLGGGGFWHLLIISSLFMVTWSALMPLCENLTLLTIHDKGLQYGRIRLWGSLAFILSAVLSGQVLEDRAPMLIYWLILGAVLFALLATGPLPDTRAAPPESGHPPLRTLLRNGPFLLLCTSAALIQGSHGVYYAFGTLHWQSVGHGESLIGALWAEGVIAEIILFFFGARLIDRFGAIPLVLLGGAAAALRWTITGLTDDLSLLASVQVLHAFTYGATHLGAMTYIARTIPSAHSATAQSLYAAMVMGLGIGLSIFAAGYLYAALAGQAYLFMALLGLAGLSGALLLRRGQDG
ncbi:MFS transporter [Magnetospira thiophila]